MDYEFPEHEGKTEILPFGKLAMKKVGRSTTALKKHGPAWVCIEVHDGLGQRLPVVSWSTTSCQACDKPRNEVAGIVLNISMNPNVKETTFVHDYDLDEGAKAFVDSSCEARARFRDMKDSGITIDNTVEGAPVSGKRQRTDQTVEKDEVPGIPTEIDFKLDFPTFEEALKMWGEGGLHQIPFQLGFKKITEISR